MALIDFGVKARRELAKARHELAIKSASYNEMYALASAFEQDALWKHRALQEIASSTAKAGSAMKLANIAREALGLPLKRKGDA